MGNAASSIFGGGDTSSEAPQKQTTEAKYSSVDHSSSGRSTALTEAEKTEAAQYSALFGGTPKAAKKKKGRSNSNTGNSKRGASNKKQEGAASGKTGADELDFPDDWKAVDTEGNSVPASPYRSDNDFPELNRGGTNNGDASGPISSSAVVVQVGEDPEAKCKRVAKAVADKISYLQKQQAETQTQALGGCDPAAGSNGALPHETQVPRTGTLVPVAASGGATEAARARAAVENALFGGPEAAALAAAAAHNEMLGLGGAAGAQGGALSSAGGPGGVAGVAPRHSNQRPVPPRNFKCKV